MNKPFHCRWLALVLLVCLWPTGLAHAATLSLRVEPVDPSITTPLTVSVFFSAEGQSVNVVDGSINITQNLNVAAVSTGSSQVGLWAVPPQFSLHDRMIRFTGGTPPTLPANGPVLLFSFTLLAPFAGTYAITPGTVQAFLNDGTGKAIGVRGDALTFSVSSSTALAMAPHALTDTTAPTIVSLALGKDPTLFDGRTFLTLFATDTGSGVERTEVKEGWFGHYGVMDRYYVLRDQYRLAPLWVRVVDAAGNTTIEEVPSNNVALACIALVLGVFGLLVTGLYLWRRRLRQ